MTSLPMETLQELPPLFKHVDGTHMVFLHTFKVLLQRFPSTQFAREKERERDRSTNPRMKKCRGKKVSEVLWKMEYAHPNKSPDRLLRCLASWIWLRVDVFLCTLKTTVIAPSGQFAANTFVFFGVWGPLRSSKDTACWTCVTTSCAATSSCRAPHQPPQPRPSCPRWPRWPRCPRCPR